ncbi:MAG: hypothetical protein IJU53_10310 [Thermoguttaceae bacterium]|nr:hypothetical protein [Thermoguttaceae bacterium]
MFTFSRIHTNSDWLLPLLIFAALVWVVVRIYRRDSVELRPFWRVLLPILRVGVLLVLLWIYLQPQWVTERERKVNSCFLVFCDTSLSMTLPETNSPDSPSRSETLTKFWEETPLVQELAKRHDLIFFGLDSEARVVWTCGKTRDGIVSGSENEKENTEKKTDQEAQESFTSALKKMRDCRGTQSRQADGIREWLQSHADIPISGLILCSDGVQNAGSGPETLIEAAKERGIPIFTLGFGSTVPVVNYRIAELEAPTRVQPSDPFMIRGTVEATGLGDENRESTIKCEIWSVEQKKSVQSEGTASEGKPEDGKMLFSTTLPLSRSELTPFEFRMEPQPVGKHLYQVRIQGEEEEQNLDDNQREVEVDVMERRTRLLIFAGGPMREYQFLATALRRDKTIETDVLLQSALPPSGSVPANPEEEKAWKARIQQDADRVLLRFPVTREELFAYDGIISVDANWKVLSPDQASWVEEWTARHGGGILFIAGPVYMSAVGSWLDAPELANIRTLCPVEFYDRTSTLRQNTYSADEIWPLDWTRSGREASYLQLDDQQSTSQKIWDAFPGVYGHFPTKKLRAGATSLAAFSAPQTRMGGSAPILLATQFYGAGRTFYIGTGEFWRLRAQNPEYFTRFYTQIVRYITQGRMIQQSQRGRLMLEQDRYFPGDPIELRAQLFDPALQPLDPAKVPELTAELFLPNGKIQQVRLTVDREMQGLYTGRFSVLTEGRFRVELTIPDSEEVLVQRGEIVLSDLERDRTERDARFLTELAQQTGGEAFGSVEDSGLQTFPAKLPDRTRTLIEFASAVPVIPSEWLLGTLVFLLSLEWLLRRLLKLA